MSTQNTIQQIYIGLLGRAADQEGLAYWTAEIDEGVLTLEQLRANIVNEQPEYEAVFGGQTRAQVVAQLYRNLFNREPDDEGLDYWVNGGGASVNVDQLVMALNDGAAAADRLVLDNRTEVANHYTAELGAEGSFDAQAAGAIIADVDGTRASVTQAKAAVDGGSIEVPDANPGQTITLTDKIGENIVGTAGNDTFKAVLGSVAGAAADSTLNIGDSINGAAGVDTLELVLAGAANGTLPSGVSISNVEKVFLTHTNNAAITGNALANSATYAGIKELWQVDNDSTAAGTFGDVVVGADVVAGFRSTGSAATAVVAGVAVDGTSGTQKSASVALDGVLTGSAVAFGATTGAFETVNVSGSVVAASGAANTLGVTTDTVTKTVNAALTSNTTLTVTEGTAGTTQTIDLSDSTGNITLNVGTGTGFAGLKSVIGGSGNDVLTVDFDDNADKLAVDAGAGNDTVTIQATVAAAASIGDEGTVTLGAGKDTVTIGAVTNISAATIDATTLVENLITVTDFNTAEDVLNLDGNGLALDSTQLASINGAADLLTAVTAVEALTGAAGDTVAAFSWGGDAYVFIDDGTAGLNAGDGLIQLTGVDATEFTNIQNGNLVL